MADPLPRARLMRKPLLAEPNRDLGMCFHTRVRHLSNHGFLSLLKVKHEQVVALCPMTKEELG